jgi:hypothetical protein
MLAVFCLRLAAGLAAALLLLPSTQVNPRFFRTHLLTALGLTVVAAVFLSESADLWLWLLLGAAGVVTFAGSVSWMLEGAPGGRLFIAASAAVLTPALVLASRVVRPEQGFAAALADDLTSAALLGSATTAMLIGHSYLIAPAMSLSPLLRSLAALGLCTVLRLGLALAGLWLWKAGPVHASLETETHLWLAVRWGVGFLAPLALAWMAWETARIRSTQSATGILYVVVIFCFLGELTSQLLLDKTGFIL